MNTILSGTNHEAGPGLGVPMWSGDVELGTLIEWILVTVRACRRD